MRLESVSFKNWGILRNLKLEFAGDDARAVTVIRANSATGKTLMLEGIMWALFGKSGLERPYFGPSYVDIGSSHEVAVEIVFAHTESRGVGADRVPHVREYRARRTLTERRDAENSFTASRERFDLWEIVPKGTEEIPNPELALEAIFPAEQKGIFLTDGDAVLQFLQNDEQAYVKKAIESVLGVGVTLRALSHVKNATTDIAKQKASAETVKGLADLQTARDDLQAEIDASNKRLAEVVAALAKFSVQEQQVSADLAKALESGSATLLSNLDKATHRQAELEADLEIALARHSRLLQEPGAAHFLMRDALSTGFESLDQLRQKGDIPKHMLPVLGELLEMNECFCGESLLGDQGAARRENIGRLIQTQADKDEAIGSLTTLYYGVSADLAKKRRDEGQDDAGGAATSGEELGERWIAELTEACAQRLKLIRALKDTKNEISSINAKLAAVGHIDVPELQTKKEAIETASKQHLKEQGTLEATLEQAEKRLADLDTELRKMARASLTLKLWGAKLEAAKDIREVLERTLEVLKTKQVKRVSDELSRSFRQIMSADPDREPMKGEISGASLDPETFAIRVHSQGGADLDVNEQVNGGYRRALVFAFIWALASVSGREIPRVIDTPLGMMSPQLKKRAVQFMMQAREGEPLTQVVLLLTPSEIKDVEAELDHAGRFYTLVPTTQLPDRKTEEAQTLVCSCTHRDTCAQCAPAMT